MIVNAELVKAITANNSDMVRASLEKGADPAEGGKANFGIFAFLNDCKKKKVLLLDFASQKYDLSIRKMIDEQIKKRKGEESVCVLPTQ